MPVVGVYEVYSEGGSKCVLFLTEQEAKDQAMIAPFCGPYPANVDLSDEELSTLKIQRCLWANGLAKRLVMARGGTND